MFYELLNAIGIIIYPGKLTEIDTFRIGCIGQLNEQDMLVVVNSVKEVIDEMGIKL